MSKVQGEQKNDAYLLFVEVSEKEVLVRLKDLVMDSYLADAPYRYRASRSCDEGSIIAKWLNDPSIEAKEDTIVIAGTLAGLKVEHRLKLPKDRAVMVERIVLSNPTDSDVLIEDFSCGMQKQIADELGTILPELQSDRIVGIPLKHRSEDPSDFDVDFPLEYFLKNPGREHRARSWPPAWPEFGYMSSTQWDSEGWAWTHGENTLGIFKYNQEGMEFSVLSPVSKKEGLYLQFGGAGMVAGDPSALNRIRPGETIELGITHYETHNGDFKGVYYAFRDFLDERDCRYPKNFNPPVHWNELYDNPEWNLQTPGNPTGPRMTRPVAYTKELIEEEARKATEYGCQSLYLDPGWDTDFGTFLWGKDWLGLRNSFIQEMREKYDLGVSLHCPLATWMSVDGRGITSWPTESFQMGPDGKVLENYVCLGSRQYIDEAAKRLLDHCADGVSFFLFDGNWWNGGCWNPDHGHPVPYSMENHIQANIDLAQRIHERYPEVLIEMHDMVAGGTNERYTPVYYKHNLPRAYDENWGFELMWNTMEDIKRGRARELYYYNLGCNIPLYLHVDLRDDNEHCLVLWWSASTCRHLGIGGTHNNPAIVDAQKRAMKKYRKLEQFYKEGSFYGISEEIHLHVLEDKNAFVLNLFNLSDDSRVVEGTINFSRIGLDIDRWYMSPKGSQFDSKSGNYSISRLMAPWSTEVSEVYLVM